MVPEGTGIFRFPPSRLFPLNSEVPGANYWDRLQREREPEGPVRGTASTPNPIFSVRYPSPNPLPLGEGFLSKLCLKRNLS